MSEKRRNILFTGGSGKAGKHMLPWLAAKGYNVLNVDKVPLRGVQHVHSIVADITSAGEMHNVMETYGKFGELETGEQSFDAVVHFAAIPAILFTPDSTLFHINTVGTYNVIEAALARGIRKIIIASSETTYGVVFAKGHREYQYLPLDEEHPTEPMDSYALSKVLNEQTAKAFQLRSGADVYALRIGNVIEPHEYENFPGFFKNPALRKPICWSYIDTRDLAQIVHLCIEKDGLGYEVFNACNDHSSATQPSAELAKQFFPGTPLRGELGEHEGLLSNRKAREVLGFKEEHNWRKYVPGHAK